MVCLAEASGVMCAQCGVLWHGEAEGALLAKVRQYCLCPSEGAIEGGVDDNFDSIARCCVRHFLRCARGSWCGIARIGGESEM